jgi:hypothetical protein
LVAAIAVRVEPRVRVTYAPLTDSVVIVAALSALALPAWRATFTASRTP